MRFIAGLARWPATSVAQRVSVSMYDGGSGGLVECRAVNDNTESKPKKGKCEMQDANRILSNEQWHMRRSRIQR